MLRRIGNKKKLALEIIKYFPKDITVFIDLCFGTGAITWEMLKKYPNIYYFANDIDDDVSNLWLVMQNNDDFNQLYELVELCPYNRNIFAYFKDNKAKNKIEKALRFLYLSNYSLFGMDGGLRFSAYDNSKEVLLSEMKMIFKYLKFVKFENKDLFDVVLPLNYPKNRPNAFNGQFVYLDLPYIDTSDNYTNSFTEKDTRKTIEKMDKTGLRYAISEFKTEITEQIAKDYNLHYIEIKERQSLLNRNVEILMTNYKPEYQKPIELTLWDGFNCTQLAGK